MSVAAKYLHDSRAEKSWGGHLIRLSKALLCFHSFVSHWHIDTQIIDFCFVFFNYLVYSVSITVRNHPWFEIHVCVLGYSLYSWYSQNKIFYHFKFTEKNPIPSVTYYAQSLHSDWAVTLYHDVVTVVNCRQHGDYTIDQLCSQSAASIVNSNFTVAVQSRCISR